MLESQKFEMVDWLNDVTQPDDTITQDLIAGIEKMELMVSENSRKFVDLFFLG